MQSPQEQGSQVQPGNKYSYVFAQGGIKDRRGNFRTSITVNDVDYESEVSFNSGYQFSLGFGSGVRLTPDKLGGLRYEFGFLYGFNDPASLNRIPANGPFYIESVDDAFHSFGVETNFYYDFFLDDHFIPYVGAGAGAFFDSSTVTIGGGRLASGNEREVGSFGLTAQAIAGVTVPLGERIALTADGRYGRVVSGDYSDTDFYSANLGLQLRFGRQSFWEMLFVSMATVHAVGVAMDGSGAAPGVIGAGGGSLKCKTSFRPKFTGPHSAIRHLEEAYCCALEARAKYPSQETKQAVQMAEQTLRQHVSLASGSIGPGGELISPPSIGDVISNARGQCK